MISKKMYTPAFAKKKNIQGSTLVEVIVSVILLTLGLLALMATQLRSVSGLTEAENKSLVSQSTEALAESMLMNGTLVKTSSGNYYHSYASYLTPPVPITGNITPFSPTTNTEYTKASIADEYKKQFESELYENLIKPESSTVSSVIYTLDSSGKNMITNCQSGGTYTTIKVVWRSKSTKDRFNDYSYVLRVAN